MLSFMIQIRDKKPLFNLTLSAPIPEEEEKLRHHKEVWK